MVRPPARRSSRDVVPNVTLMSSTATYSWLLMVVIASGLRPSRDNTVRLGACAAGNRDNTAKTMAAAAAIVLDLRKFTLFSSSHALVEDCPVRECPPRQDL